MRDAKNDDKNATALSKHAVELGHSIDCDNYKIFLTKTDYHKCKFIELLSIYSLSNIRNHKKSVCFPCRQNTKICFRLIQFLSIQFSRSSTKHKFLCCAIVDYFDALILLIVSRDLVLLRCLFLRPLTHSLIEGR